MKKIIIPALFALSLSACATGAGPGQVVQQHTVEHRVIDVTTMSTGAGSAGSPPPTVSIPQAQKTGPRVREIRVAIWNRSSQKLIFYSASGVTNSGWRGSNVAFLPSPIPAPIFTVRPGQMHEMHGTVFGSGSDSFEACMRAGNGPVGNCFLVGIQLKNIPQKPLWLLETAYDSGAISQHVFGEPPVSFQPRVVKLAGSGTQKKRTIPTVKVPGSGGRSGAKTGQKSTPNQTFVP